MFRTLSSSLARWTLFLICLASVSMMLWAARTDSAIDDEVAHIPAGYGYVHNLDYRLNPEHPPLLKALALLPVLFLQPNFPTTSTAWTTEVNGEWDMGRQFLYNSGNNANEIIQTARVVPILFTILTIILIYFLARRLIGVWWGLLPAFLFAFDPAVLANGHYVTTDVAAAFGVVFSFMFFLKFIEAPTTKHLWWAGLAFGVAQITKFSTPLLGILYLFLMAVLWLREIASQWNVTDSSRRVKKFLGRGWYYLWRFVAIVAIGYGIIVYPVYFLLTSHYPIAKQVSDTTSILATFEGGATPAGQVCHGMRCVADCDITMAKNVVTRPLAQYLLGILMVFQRTDGGNTIYFLGGVVNTGGWIYFPVLFLLKEPLPTLIIIFLGLFLTIFNLARWVRHRNKTQTKKFFDYLSANFAQFSMASFVVLYWASALHSELNLGIRYVLPTFPFIFILAAGVWKKWITQFNLPQGFMNLQATNPNMPNMPTIIDPMAAMASAAEAFSALKKTLAQSAAKYLLLVTLVCWLALETLFAAPYFLSYYNEFAGGTWNGYHYATDSNYDWGQDLLRLQSFVAEHPEINKIAVDYFGGGDAKYYLGAKEVDWSSSKGNPADATGTAIGSNSTSGQGIHWLAISVNTLELATQPFVSGKPRNASDTYAWLVALRPPAPGMGNLPTPDYRIGTSIFVYKL